jgi:phosphoribosylformylglycinamidine synthase
MSLSGAEMAFAGRVGLDVDLGEPALADGGFGALFAEELGAVLQIRAADLPVVSGMLGDLCCIDLGAPRDDERIVVRAGARVLFESDRATLQSLWAMPSHRMQRLRDNPECADEEFGLITADDAGLSCRLTFDPSDDLSRGAAVIVTRHSSNGKIKDYGSCYSYD